MTNKMHRSNATSNRYHGCPYIQMEWRDQSRCHLFTIVPLSTCFLFFVILLIRTFQFRSATSNRSVVRWEFPHFLVATVVVAGTCCVCLFQISVIVDCIPFLFVRVFFAAHSHLPFSLSRWQATRQSIRNEHLQRVVTVRVLGRISIRDQTRNTIPFRRHNRNRRTGWRNQKKEKNGKMKFDRNTSKSRYRFVNATLSYSICFFLTCFLFRSTFFSSLLFKSTLPFVRACSVDFWIYYYCDSVSVCVFCVWISDAANECHAIAWQDGKVSKNKWKLKKKIGKWARGESARWHARKIFLNFTWQTCRICTVCLPVTSAFLRFLPFCYLFVDSRALRWCQKPFDVCTNLSCTYKYVISM